MAKIIGYQVTVKQPGFKKVTTTTNGSLSAAQDAAVDDAVAFNPGSVRAKWVVDAITEIPELETE